MVADFWCDLGVVAGDTNLNRVQFGNVKLMHDPAQLGRERRRILEIHRVEPNGLHGGFTERLR